MRILRAGLVYFASVFAVGFALAPVRELWLVPTFGQRTGELLEFPVMMAAMIPIAAWINRRWLKGSRAATRLGAGLVALSAMLLAELGVVLWIRGVSLGDYVADRDPVAGSVYLTMLVLFSLLPWLLSRRSAEPDS
jgi:hypothetical protein